MTKQPPFALNAAAIPGKACIRADDAVARNHDRNRIGAIGKANSASGVRAPKLSRQRAITQRRPRPNAAQCRPDLLLKRRASCRNRNRIDRGQVSREITGKWPPNCRRRLAPRQDKIASVLAIMQPQELPHSGFEVMKVENPQTLFGIMDKQHRPDRALNRVDKERLRRHRYYPLNWGGLSLSPHRPSIGVAPHKRATAAMPPL